MHGCEEVVRILLERWVICCSVCLNYLSYLYCCFPLLAWGCHCILVENIVLYFIIH